jgi:kumamolisin
VLGLDNRRHARPHFRRLPKLGGGWWAPAVGVSYPPNQIAALYNFPTNLNGAGETIALIELGGGYRMPDLVKYFASIGVSPPPSVTAVSVLGAINTPTGPSGPDGEVMLDIEVAGAIAPGAQITVYFAPNTDRGFLAAINTAIFDNVRKPSVVSISWGGPERSWTPQAMRAVDQAFQAGAALGVTVCCAAGDGGSTDGLRDGLVNADFPASSPSVLACGGTRLLSASGAISSEVVWNDGPQGGATGGGVSEFFPRPSWQANANVPPSGNASGYVGRGLPDVAGNADPTTGYQARVDGRDITIGGTSAVAPLWAGLIALANQSVGKRVGYITPLLYQQLGGTPSAFRDITAGNNDSTNLGRGYNATHGWDACTGFGSPNGSAIIAALSGPQTGARPQTAQATQADTRSEAASELGETPTTPAAEPGVTPPPPAVGPTKAAAASRAAIPRATSGRATHTRRQRSSNGDEAIDKVATRPTNLRGARPVPE